MIWAGPIALTALQALLNHPYLPITTTLLGHRHTTYLLICRHAWLNTTTLFISAEQLLCCAFELRNPYHAAFALSSYAHIAATATPPGLGQQATRLLDATIPHAPITTTTTTLPPIMPLLTAVTTSLPLRVDLNINHLEGHTCIHGRRMKMAGSGTVQNCRDVPHTWRCAADSSYALPPLVCIVPLPTPYPTTTLPAPPTGSTRARRVSMALTPAQNSILRSPLHYYSAATRTCHRPLFTVVVGAGI